ncbi:HAD family hydrolase [Listeria monocytogenes]|uniref:HAD family hydrolase n=1 Tax=Listeria monocytogenes TaxID=1639 RepID=UPI0039761B4D
MERSDLYGTAVESSDRSSYRDGVLKRRILSSVDHNEPVSEIAGSGIKKGTVRVGKTFSLQYIQKLRSLQAVLPKRQHDHSRSKRRGGVGYFSLSDQIRRQSADAVANFQKEGIKVTLLTGDNEEVTETVAEVVGVDDYKASMLPKTRSPMSGESG